MDINLNVMKAQKREKLWNYPDNELVTAEQVTYENIAGRQKISSLISEDVYEFIFDLESNVSLTTDVTVNKHWKTLKETITKLYEALEWFGIESKYVYPKTSGRGIHIEIFACEIRSVQQFQKIAQAIVTKAELPNIKSNDFLKQKEVAFGVDLQVLLQPKRRIREYGGQNDKLGFTHYCSHVPIGELLKKRKYPFTTKTEEIKYPQIKLFQVTKEFIDKVNEISIEQAIQSLSRESDEEQDWNQIGDVNKLMMCPTYKKIVEKAEVDHHLLNLERLFVAQFLVRFGTKGADEIHHIMKFCGDYEEDYTQGQINNIITCGRKPCTCNWAKTFLGSLCDGCKGVPNGRSPIKYVYGNLTLQDIYSKIQQMLSLKTPDGHIDTETVDVALAQAVERNVDGIPVWLFLVAASGGTKTALLKTIFGYPKVYTISSITSKSLVSGSVVYDKKLRKNVSVGGILHEWNGKTVIIKDFTKLLATRKEEKEAVFGTLRDAFDGMLEIGFGTLKHKVSIKSEFGMLAAVTPIIDFQYRLANLLGERFLKFRHNLGEDDMLDIIMNTEEEDFQRWQKEIRTYVRRFLQGLKFNYKIKLTNEQKQEIKLLAKYIVFMRRPTHRDIILVGKQEYATRPLKQLKKFAYQLCYVYGIDTPNKRVMSILARIAFSTPPIERTTITQLIYKKGESMTQKDLAKAIGLSETKLMRALGEMCEVKILKRVMGLEYENTSELNTFYDMWLPLMKRAWSSSLQINTFKYLFRKRGDQRKLRALSHQDKSHPHV